MTTSKNILLVEDNQSDVDLTRRALQRARILNELVVASDGAEALEYLENGAQQPAWEMPAMILLDLKLPKISGIEVLRRIRENQGLRRLPVVILTSSKDEQDLAAVYDFGVNSYVRKPVDFNQFAHCIEQLGLYWLVLNEPPPRREPRDGKE